MAKGNENLTCYFGNFPYDTTEDDLKRLLVGRDIKRVTVGFGFVDFGNEADAHSAIEAFDGVDFGGRELRVNFARERARGAACYTRFADRAANKELVSRPG